MCAVFVRRRAAFVRRDRISKTVRYGKLLLSVRNSVAPELFRGIGKVLFGIPGELVGFCPSAALGITCHACHLSVDVKEACVRVKSRRWLSRRVFPCDTCLALGAGRRLLTYAIVDIADTMRRISVLLYCCCCCFAVMHGLLTHEKGTFMNSTRLCFAVLHIERSNIPYRYYRKKPVHRAFASDRTVLAIMIGGRRRGQPYAPSLLVALA